MCQGHTANGTRQSRPGALLLATRIRGHCMWYRAREYTGDQAGDQEARAGRGSRERSNLANQTTDGLSFNDFGSS